MKQTIYIVLAVSLLAGVPVSAQIEARLDARLETRTEQGETRAEARAETQAEREEALERRRAQQAEMQENRAERQTERQENRAETQTEIEARAETRQENRAEARTDRQETRQDRQAERQTERAERRADVVLRLAKNIVVRLESGVRKMTQIYNRIETAIAERAETGLDTSEAEASLQLASSSLAEAEAEIASINAQVDNWGTVDIASDDFQSLLTEQKDALRTSMRTAQQALSTTGKHLRDSVRALINSIRTSATSDTSANAETE